MQTDEQKLGAKSGKEEKMFMVAQATLKILNQHGLSGVSFARVARAAGVSRAWLYKYIGGSDQELVDFTIDTFGTMWGRLDRPDLHGDEMQWQQGIMERFSHFLDSNLKYPWILPIYFRYRGTKTILGDRIVLIEQKYLKRQVGELQKSFQLSPAQARLTADVLLGIRLGLAYQWMSGDLQNAVTKGELVSFLGKSLKTLIQSGKKHRA